MENNSGIYVVGGTTGTPGQGYTTEMNVVMNGVILLSPEWWGYYLLGYAILFLYFKVVGLLSKLMRLV